MSEPNLKKVDLVRGKSDMKMANKKSDLDKIVDKI